MVDRNDEERPDRPEREGRRGPDGKSLATGEQPGEQVRGAGGSGFDLTLGDRPRAVPPLECTPDEPTEELPPQLPLELDQVVESTARLAEDSQLGHDPLSRFLALADEDPVRALVFYASLVEPHEAPRSADELLSIVAVSVARLAEQLAEAVDAILHHPRFQRLEASWRGLELLCTESARHELTVVRALDASWREIGKDLDRAVEFDQSALFHLIYTSEFDMPGGRPYGLLVGDFQLGGEATSKAGGDGYDVPSRLQDVRTLELLSQVAAAAFAPVVLGVSHRFFGLEDIGELERPIRLDRILEQAEYASWRGLRRTEDARFVALTLPRVLLREPLRPDARRVDGFPYRERACRRSDYLWGNAAFAFGCIVLRDFGQSKWTGAIRGVERDSESGGIVSNLVGARFDTDRSDGTLRQSVEVQLTDRREQQLSDLGFLPIAHCPHTPFSAFHGSSTIQYPERYDKEIATINARISALVQSMLCVSRFAHYIKVLGRDKIGSFQTAEQCERYLNNWLVQYVSASDDLSSEMKAKRPLREGEVQVREIPGRPGAYACTVHLRPHYQLDQLAAAIRLTTELAPRMRD